MRILVVDDEPAVRDAVDRALRLDGPRGRARRGRPRGARRARRGAARRARARPADAARRRARGVPPAARRRRPHAGARAHRARRGRRPRRAGSTPAPTTTSSSRSRSRSCSRACARCCAAPAATTTRTAALRFADLALDPVAYTVRRGERPARADAHRVPAARAVPAPPAPGAHALDHLRPRLGLRLRPGVELARGLRRLPAAQDRGGRRAAAAAHGARRRLRPARAVSFRRRLTLACAAAVALAVVLAAGLTYWFVRDTLRDQIDASLRSALPLDGAAAAAGARPRARLERARRLRLPSPLDGPVAVHPARHAGGARRGAARRAAGPAARPASELQAVAAGERGPFFADVERRRPAPARLHGARRPTAACSRSRGSLDEVDATLGTLRLGLGVIVLLGVARRAGARAARHAHRGQPVAELTDAAEHVARTRDLTRRIERERRRRAVAARRRVQHDARGARRLPARAAPAGRRRVARAAHAAHVAAHQPRGARARRARRRPTTSGCAPT